MIHLKHVKSIDLKSPNGIFVSVVDEGHIVYRNSATERWKKSKCMIAKYNLDHNQPESPLVLCAGEDPGYKTKLLYWTIRTIIPGWLILMNPLTHIGFRYVEKTLFSFLPRIAYTSLNGSKENQGIMKGDGRWISDFG